MWTDFPAAQAAVSGDVIVGLLGGTANQRFTAASWLFKANNLSDVATPLTAFNNISPLTTTGDMLIFTGGANARLAIGTTGYIMTVAGGVPTWAANPGLLIANNLSDLGSLSTALSNLGLAAASNVTFATLTTTGINTESHASGLTAHSGGGQGSAIALTAAINQITTVAAANDSAKLPPAVAGKVVLVIQAAASNSMNLFPSSGDQINALGANAAFAMAAGTITSFVCPVAGQWYSK